MVERCLAKANVASSNLVFRSNEKTAPSARFQTSLKSIAFRLVFSFPTKRKSHYTGFRWRFCRGFLTRDLIFK